MTLNKFLAFELYDYIYRPTYKVPEWLKPVRYRQLLSNDFMFSGEVLLGCLDIYRERSDRALIYCKNLNFEKMEEEVRYMDFRSWEYLYRNCEIDKVLDFIIRYEDNFVMRYEEFNIISWREILSKPNDRLVSHLINLVKSQKLEIHKLCFNPHPKILDFLEENITSITTHAWIYLCSNTNTSILKFIEKNIYFINSEGWAYLFYNPNPYVINILEKHIDRINWITICKNSTNDKIPYFIEKYIDKINRSCWDVLSWNPNPNIYILVEKYFNKFNIRDLCKNTDDRVIDLIFRNKNLLDDKCWSILVENSNNSVIDSISSSHIVKFLPKLCNNKNPKILKILDKYIEIMDSRCWINLCLHENDDFIDFLKRHSSRLDSDAIRRLCSNRNPSVMDILERHKDKVVCSEYNIQNLWFNAGIFRYDIIKNKTKKEIFYKMISE